MGWKFEIQMWIFVVYLGVCGRKLSHWERNSHFKDPTLDLPPFLHHFINKPMNRFNEKGITLLQKWVFDCTVQVLGDTTVTILVSSPQIDTLSLWPLFSQLSSIMHQWKKHFPSKILDGKGGSVNVELHLLVRGQRSRCGGRLWRSPSPCSHRQTIHSGMGGGHCVVHQASESVEWKIIVRPRCKCTGRPGRQTLAPLCCRGGRREESHCPLSFSELRRTLRRGKAFGIPARPRPGRRLLSRWKSIWMFNALHCSISWSERERIPRGSVRTREGRAYGNVR